MNRKILLPISILLAIIAGTLAALEIYKTATIVVDDQFHIVAFWGFSVSDALVAADIPIYEGDMITPGLDDPIQEDGTISITRATWVVIAVDDEYHTLWTSERVPTHLLSLATIQLNPGDEVRSNGFPVDPDQALLYAPSLSLQVFRATQVILDDDGERHAFTSTARSLGDALWEAGINLHNADWLTPPADTLLDGGELYAAIERSREITIRTKYHVVQARVLAETVGEALSKAGMALQGLNYSLPPEDAPIPIDGQIQIIQVHEEVILEQEPLPFSLIYQASSDVDLDTQRVLQVGEYGVMARRVRVVYEDEQEVSQVVENEWAAKQPVSRIIGYGTRITIQTTNTPDGPIEYYRSVDAYATSYSPCRIGVPDQCSSRTASGAELKKGVIGVIRSWYNYMKGAAVYITGYGFATIEDIGAGFSDRHWVDLGYTDDDWVSWSGHVTVYFLTPAPSSIMYILE
jgi:uncharacterized protein YabE (DUF348 family)